VRVAGFGFGAAPSKVGEAFLEGGDFAEPDVVARFGEAGLGVAGHLLHASELGGVDPEEAAAGAGGHQRPGDDDPTDPAVSATTSR
jgi:hypothetical protein